jgi:hypothetical protein
MVTRINSHAHQQADEDYDFSVPWEIVDSHPASAPQDDTEQHKKRYHQPPPFIILHLNLTPPQPRPQPPQTLDKALPPRHHQMGRSPRILQAHVVRPRHLHRRHSHRAQRPVPISRALASHARQRALRFRNRPIRPLQHPDHRALDPIPARRGAPRTLRRR